MSSERLNAIYILGDGLFEKVYGPDEQRDIAARVNILAPPCNAAAIASRPEILREADVVLSSWGMAVLDETLLGAAPRLKAVFYGAGSVKGFVTEAFWQRGIVLSSAWGANAVPVSEFTLSRDTVMLAPSPAPRRPATGTPGCSGCCEPPGEATTVKLATEPGMTLAL